MMRLLLYVLHGYKPKEKVGEFLTFYAGGDEAAEKKAKELLEEKGLVFESLKSWPVHSSARICRSTRGVECDENTTTCQAA